MSEKSGRLTSFTDDEVLSALDLSRTARPITFPLFDNTNAWLIGGRLAVFGDKNDWAIAIGVLSFSTHSFGHACVRNVVSTCGNCLVSGAGSATDFFSLTSDATSEPTFSGVLEHYIAESVRQIMIRDQIVQLDSAWEMLGQLGLIRNGSAAGKDLLRALFKQNGGVMRASVPELRSRIPSGLPMYLMIDEWRHPKTLELPSDTECFGQLSEVLTRREASCYNPTEPPNCSYEYWPLSGSN